MDIVIVKAAFNDGYGNNSTCVDFSIQDTVFNAIIEASDLSILAIFPQQQTTRIIFKPFE